MEKFRGQRILCLWIENFTLQNTHDLITNLFNAKPSHTKELAKIAHTKVKGNAFFLIQFLIALQDKGHIFYNIGTTKWKSDVATIQKSTVISNNVVIMLMEKMKKLDDNSRQMLTIMSSLGSLFEETVVEIIAPKLAGSSLLPTVETNANTNVTLEALVDAGFVEMIQDCSKKEENILLCPQLD